MSTPVAYLNANDAIAFASGALSKAGLPAEHASVMASCLVQADLRGVTSHGLLRLEQYLARASTGLVNLTPSIEIKKLTPVAAQVDGDNGFGFVVATTAMKEAIRIAETFGISIVIVKHSNHFGMAASYLLQAISAGMMAFVFSNAAKNMPPFGSKEALFGTSPFAAGAPSDTEIPFILDMAPSVVAKGKIRVAARTGRSIPEGWAVDQDGVPTTDPIAAIKGMVVPIGGAKGSGLAMLMDIMAGVLSGAAFGGEVGDQYRDARPQNVGHCFIVIKPDLFLGKGTTQERMDTLIRKVHSCEPATGFDKVLVPGEPEYRLTEKRLQEGIPLQVADVQMLDQIAANLDLSKLQFSPIPLQSTPYTNGDSGHHSG